MNWNYMDKVLPLSFISSMPLSKFLNLVILHFHLLKNKINSGTHPKAMSEN